ncbi:MAG: redoxin domain-containing protein [Longimicrobiales bacterium]
MCLPIGAVAPDFDLPVTLGGQTVRLSDYKGKKTVVILFFPLAFSSVCTAEVCAVAEDYSRWKTFGAGVIGISTDSPYVNQKFATECGASFPIASDYNKTVSKEYQVLLDDMMGLKGVTNRVVYVVNKEGRIIYVWKGEHPGVMPPLEEVVTIIEKES